MAIVTELGGERFVSIQTVRRDGTPVATPVWVVAFDDHLYVWTGSQTGQGQTDRHNPAAGLAPCTRRGTVTGPAVPAQAVIVPVSERPLRSGPCSPPSTVWDCERSDRRADPGVAASRAIS